MMKQLRSRLAQLSQKENPHFDIGLIVEHAENKPQDEQDCANSVALLS